MQYLSVKRLLVLFIFLVTAVLLGFGLWYVFFRPVSLTTETPALPEASYALPRAGNSSGTNILITAPGSLPQAGYSQTITEEKNQPKEKADGLQTTLIAQNITRPISVSPQNQGVVRYYDESEGKFYYALPDGGKAAISEKVFFHVKDVAWGKRSDKAILSFPDGSKLFYDFTNDVQASLPSYWEDIEFSPQDEQIVAKSLGRSRSNRFLITANPDGTESKAIEELGDNQSKVQVSWSPNDHVIAFSHTGDPIGQDREAVLLIGKEHENFQSLITDGRGFIPNWSPSGNILAYSVYKSTTGYRPLLWVSGAASNNVNAGRSNFNLFTWADKCAWQSERTLICGVPIELGEGAALQRELFDTGPDVLYRIDITTGRVTVLGPIEGNGAVKDITIDPGDTSIFIT